MFAILSHIYLNSLIEVYLMHSSGSNRLMTLSILLLDREFGVKTESAILSPQYTSVQMQSLTVGSPLATGCWKMARIIMHLSHSCFLFTSITSHYLRQGHGLGGPFEVTYVAKFALFIYGMENTPKSKHSGVFCTSECLTVSAGSSPHLRFNGIYLWEIMTNKDCCFTCYQGVS